MTDLAYMVREDWGQHGTAMDRQSAVIREWLGEPPYLFGAVDPTALRRGGRSADLETIEYIAPNPPDRAVVAISELRQIGPTASTTPVIVLHPYSVGELETLRKVVAEAVFARVFVMIWSPHDRSRIWLDAFAALDLHTGARSHPSNPLMIEAASMVIRHQYNGLSSGRGKDAVVQLVRAFAGEGYPTDTGSWLRAYFRAGGDFDNAQSIAKLIDEIHAGTRHRVKPAYVDGIFNVIRERVEQSR